MPFKKAAAAAAALLMFAAMPCLSAFAAEAEKETVTAEETAGYTTAAVDACVYSEEPVSVDLRYYADMPNVAYISYADFFKMLGGDDVAVQTNEDGTVLLTHPLGFAAALDPESDVFYLDPNFIYPSSMLTEESPYSKSFIMSAQNVVSELPEMTEEEAAAAGLMVLNFAQWGIDLRSDENAVYVPVTTLCDVLSNGLMNAGFTQNKLIFSNELIIDLPIVDEIGAYLNDNSKNGRPADLAEYNYKELCFYFDNTYGLPGRPYYTQTIAEKGLDGFLSDTSDATRQAKEWLLSTDFTEFLAGWRTLNALLFDGGHTGFYIPSSLDDAILDERDALLEKANLEDPGLIDYMTLREERAAKMETILATREEVLAGDVQNLKELHDATYFEKGDTAFFIFDSFDSIDYMGWLVFYNIGGENPEDMLKDYVNCVIEADANPDIKNFVLDISANGGGYIDLARYMASIAANASTDYTKINAYDYRWETIFACDKNLDGLFDEADENFSTDLRFGVLTSGCSFSAANIFPSICHDNGVLLMGEQSGGGACNVEFRLTAEGFAYGLSAGMCACDKNFDSIDNGIPVDFELFTKNADGTLNVSAMYDIDTIDKCFNEFYGKEEEPIVTTTAPEETTAAQTTTTTTAYYPIDTELETTTTVETTTETTTTAAEKTVFASAEKAGEMAKKDYKSKKGTKPAESVVTENSDGTYTVVLKDKKGNVLDTYTVDSETGVGTDSEGNEVNLPQTGTNSDRTAAAAAAAAVLTLFGAAAMKQSGLFRKKEDEE